ncbi:Hypothetical predicted protein [Cloeon dipterum]|uniref:NADH dehydrogenase [ubiquinone] 1 alpha subcomplex assembly factor 4 n=1 Tax=Cloeon dipterum TaxID=197152 RepID=A0A8S1CXB2_9INSE|nr:Hypothetical predicted protein [Cloeon dipterum]
MGQASSRVFHFLTKDIRNIIIENRAHKVISRDKPQPAPRYPATERELERLAADHPEILAEQSRKSSDLDDRLKKVFVVSHDPDLQVKQEANPSRPLPLQRKPIPKPEFGFEEPSQVAAGKVTFKQAIKFITDHQDDPARWNADTIAKHYKLETEVVDNILVHFRPFLLLVPEGPGEKRKSVLAAAPATPKLQSSSFVIILIVLVLGGGQVAPVPAPNGAVVAHAHQHLAVAAQARLANRGGAFRMLQLVAARLARLVRLIELPHVGPAHLVAQRQGRLPLVHGKADEPRINLN